MSINAYFIDLEQVTPPPPTHTSTKIERSTGKGLRFWGNGVIFALMLFALGFAGCKDDAKESVSSEFDNPQVQWKIAKMATQVQQTLDELFAQGIDVNIDRSKLFSSIGKSKAEQARISLINSATQMLWVVEALEDELDNQGNTSVSTAKLNRLYEQARSSLSSLKNGETFSLEDITDLLDTLSDLQEETEKVREEAKKGKNEEDINAEILIKKNTKIVNTAKNTIRTLLDKEILPADVYQDFLRNIENAEQQLIAVNPPLSQKSISAYLLFSSASAIMLIVNSDVIIVEDDNWETEKVSLLSEITTYMNLLQQDPFSSKITERIAALQNALEKLLIRIQDYTQKGKLKNKYYPNKEAGEKFLEENRIKEGVTTTESGLQYKVITEGTGDSPVDGDAVRVHYTGTLIDGTKFDSSVDRGEPIVITMNQVIPGWTEMLKLMKVGEKVIAYIPSNLAYGERGTVKIPPYSMLIFEMELIAIVK